MPGSATSATRTSSSSSDADRVEVERTVLDRGRERSNVAGLLPAEAVGAKLLVAGAQDPGRRQPSEPRDEAVVRRARGGERHLLLEDQEHERLESGLARPELREPMPVDDRRERGVA